MDQYLLIPFLVGWTSIYQLFWCSPGVQGFDTLPFRHSSSAGIEILLPCGDLDLPKKKSLIVALADEKKLATYPLTLLSSNNQAQQWNKKKTFWMWNCLYICEQTGDVPLPVRLRLADIQKWLILATETVEISPLMFDKHDMTISFNLLMVRKFRISGVVSDGEKRWKAESDLSHFTLLLAGAFVFTNGHNHG